MNVATSLRRFAFGWPFAVALVAALLTALLAASGARAVINLPAPEGRPAPLADFDSRSGSVAPTSAQTTLAQNLGATVRWNRFGTPQSISKEGTFISTGVQGGSAGEAARNWLAANKALFRLTSLDSLRLEKDTRLSGSDGHAVLFRQYFGDLPAQRDGLVTLGVTGSSTAGWKVAYVSSSISGDTALEGPVALSPEVAWLEAAENVGRSISVVNVTNSHAERGWTVFTVPGYAESRARLTALPRPGAAAVPAFETLLVDPSGNATAYRSFVDARTGDVLTRQNLVMHSHVPPPTTFTGETPFGDCDVPKLIGVIHNDSPQMASVEVAASYVDASADLVLKLKINGVTVTSQDTGTSPEVIRYEPSSGLPPGTYEAQVCHLAGSTVPQTGLVLNYVGSAIFSPAGESTAFAHPPKWRVFPAYPKPATVLGFPWNVPDDDIRQLWCWDTVVQGTPVPGCEGKEEVKNLASRAPWDFDTKLNVPTYTTRGNNAISAESWLSTSLTPGPTQHKPISFTRTYDNPGSVPPAEFSNDWFHSSVTGGAPEGCGDADPRSLAQRSFTPGLGFDINAAAINLFVAHNRMHDWSYFLGFDEENYNAQDDNFGETPPSRENDALFGDVQEAAVSKTPLLGRTNANMIPTPDGVHPITNMYLWQAFAGVIYVPCVDGDLDMSIIGHEYGHLIENRMIGKGGTRAGFEAGAMGEGYGDLFGMEVLNEHGYVPVTNENRYVIGSYVSGNKQRSIRNYAMNQSPLNYSDIGYDPSTGPEVHADGEIWMAINWELRQLLAAKYNASYPESDKGLQKECANRIRPAYLCPGNRRWIQLVFDGMLLMPADPTMVDARDAILAADLMRSNASSNWPSNQNELWLGFARRGLGRLAYNTPGGNNDQPRPDFSSPRHVNTSIAFQARDAQSNAPITNATIYVGDYEARVSPIADTNPNTNATSPASPNNLDATAAFAPGTYSFIAHAPGYGHVRFTRTFGGGFGSSTITISMARNLASRSAGALPVGVATCTPSSGDPDDECDLIDDTEATAWEGIGSILNVPSVAGQRVTVDLAGGLQTFNRVQVSGMGDPDEAGKFSWLRAFEIWACSSNCVTSGGAVNNASFTKIYTSPTDAFPGDAPWPVSPQVTIRGFTVPTTQATHVQLRVVSDQCTGQPQFQGEQDGDPTNPTDCITSPVSLLFGGPWLVTAAELQVFGAQGTTNPPPGDGGGGGGDPVVKLTKSGPSTARPGETITYTLNYTNLGPADAANARIVDSLPAGVSFVSASGGGTYSSFTRKVTWNLGTVPANSSGGRTVTVRISSSAASGSSITNRADFTATLTTSPPTATWTTVIQG